MATDKKKRLPKELQEYKKQLKELDFKRRVKEYFDCSPFQRALDELKKEVIYKSFSKAEREEFDSKYLPILLTIDRYGDRVRAIYGNCFIYSLFIDTTLRQIKSYSYTADFLNGIIPLAETAQKGIKGEEYQSALEKAIKGLKSYRTVVFNTPKITGGKNGKYGVNSDEVEKELHGIINTFRKLLSQIKCFLESMKEFLEWVGAPELFPREYKDMEAGFLTRYQSIELREREGENVKKFPLFMKILEAEREYLSIDFKELPLTIEMFGENNIWIEHYKKRYGRN